MSMRIDADSLRMKLGFHIGANCLIPENLPNLINTDSRTISAGQWFWPIKGPTFDGHMFIENALSKGASGFSYQKSHAHLLSNDLKAKGIELADSLKGLQQLSNLWRRQASQLRLVGITGSSGKTTAKEMLTHVLSAIAPTLGTRSSFNNEIGVPLTLCRLDASHRLGVIEMGARHRGDIQFLCDIVQPDVALLLNVGVAHLGAFGDFASLRQSKLEIFTSTPSSVVAVCPDWDHGLLAVANQYHEQVVTFGSKEGTTVQLLSSQATKDGRLIIDILVDGRHFSANLPIFHEALAINVCATLACGFALNADLKTMVQALGDFHGVHRRFEIIKTDNLTIIDDSFNANPESMMAGLKSLAKGFGEYKKILILGDMLELGNESENAHKSIGQYCVELKPELLITVGKESRQIAAAAQAAGLSSASIRQYENVEELRHNLDKFLAYGNLLYAKASNGIKLYKIVDDLTCNHRA